MSKSKLHFRFLKHFFAGISRPFVINKESGNVMMFVLGLIPVVLFLSYAGLESIKKSFDKQEGVVMDRASIALIANQIKAIVDNKGSWRETVFLPTNISASCLRTNNAVCPVMNQAQRELTLMVDSTRVYLQPDPLPTGRYKGFTRLGISCDNYHPTNPDSLCVYRARVFWNPDCTPPCFSVRPASSAFATSPRQNIIMQFSYSSSADSIANEVNVEMLNSDFVRDGDNRSLEVFCESLAAQVAGGGTSCRMTMTPKNCRTSEGRHMVDRVERNGNVLCANPRAVGTGIEAVCPGGNAMVGFANDGFVCDVF